MNNSQLELARHCKICQNLDFNISYGTKCGLTKKKPDFNDKCHKIEIGKNAETYITDISVEKELVDKSKLDYIGTFIIYLIISLFFMIGGTFLTRYLFGFGVFHTVTLILIGIGIIILPKSFGTLNMYRAKKNVADEKIRNLEKTLQKYNKHYQVDLEINDIHGIKEVRSKVRIY